MRMSLHSQKPLADHAACMRAPRHISWVQGGDVRPGVIILCAARAHAQHCHLAQAQGQGQGQVPGEAGILRRVLQPYMSQE